MHTGLGAEFFELRKKWNDGRMSTYALHEWVQHQFDKIASTQVDASALKPSTDAPQQQSASSTQIGGTHYTDLCIQPWDALKAWLTADELRGYHKGVIIAYIARERRKNGIEDLRKAHHHLSKLLEDIASDEAQVSYDEKATR